MFHDKYRIKHLVAINAIISHGIYRETSLYLAISLRSFATEYVFVFCFKK